MAYTYTPYYPGGWQSGEQGGTPITPEALNNMETGIVAAMTKIIFITLNNITLNDHSTKTFDLSSYIPNGYNLWSVNVTMRGSDGRFYQLPWISSDGSATSVEAAPLNSNYPKTISIKDSVGGWGTTNMYITAFLQPV